MTTGEELDGLAASYYLDPPADVWLEERVQAWILPWLTRQCSGRVLEMGYGTGIVAKALRAADVDLDIVEGSGRLVRAAGTAGFTAIRALFEEYDPGPVFDTVLALHVLEHVDQPVELLRRIRGWLRPGGQVIVVTPNARSFHRLVGSKMTGAPPETLSERDRLVGHRRVFTVGELIDVLVDAGLGCEAGVPAGYFGWFLKPVHNALMLDWAPELIDALCELGWEGDPEDAANIGVIGRR